MTGHEYGHELDQYQKNKILLFAFHDWCIAWFFMLVSMAMGQSYEFSMIAM